MKKRKKKTTKCIFFTLSKGSVVYGRDVGKKGR